MFVYMHSAMEMEGEICCVALYCQQIETSVSLIPQPLHSLGKIPCCLLDRGCAKSRFRLDVMAFVGNKTVVVYAIKIPCCH